tara:strand:- start:393 stop:635 length:243 start_codon:yes stop_codon:yes gene_type:complete
MNKEVIINNLQDIFRDIFDEDTLIISYKTSPDELNSWDSLNHILLMSAVQEEFNLKIGIEEMQLLVNVEDIVNMIINKIN